MGIQDICSHGVDRRYDGCWRCDDELDSQSELIGRYAPDTECHACKNKVWAEGDIEYSPPGYGVYYCKPLDKDLTEEQAKHKGRLDGCPIVGT